MIQSRSVYKGSFIHNVDTDDVDIIDVDDNNNDNNNNDDDDNNKKKKKKKNRKKLGLSLLTATTTPTTTTTSSLHTSTTYTSSSHTDDIDDDGIHYDENNNIHIPYNPTNEPNKYPIEEEMKGLQQILSLLTNNEKLKLIQQYGIDKCGNLCMRHYRADKGDVEKAIGRIRYVMKWRDDFGVEKIINAVHGHSNNDSNDNDEDDDDKKSIIDPEMKELRDIIRHEGETGKVYTRGYSKQGHAIIYFFPVRENTTNVKNNMRHLVYQLERAIAATEKKNHEKIIIIMDFVNWTIKKQGPMSRTKETIHILQECYVERMKRVYLTNTPVIFRTFWAMVKPFLDPVTKEKIVFCSGGRMNVENLMKDELDMSVLEKCAFGTKDLKPFDSKEYFSMPLDVVYDEEEEE